MKDIKTAYQISGNFDHYSEGIDTPLEDLLAEFEYDCTSQHVPLGIAMLRFGSILEALDWHLYATQKVSYETAREKIKWAADLMDKKFDVKYEKLPR